MIAIVEDQCTTFDCEGSLYHISLGYSFVVDDALLLVFSLSIVKCYVCLQLYYVNCIDGICSPPP